MKIALVHDMAECIVGDITPQDGISKEDKHKKEKVSYNIQMTGLGGLFRGHYTAEMKRYTINMFADRRRRGIQ